MTIIEFSYKLLSGRYSSAIRGTEQQPGSTFATFFHLEGALELLVRRCLDERVGKTGYNPVFPRVTEEKSHQEIFPNGPAREARQMRTK